MASSACLASILHSRFLSSELGFDGGNGDQPKPCYIHLQATAASRFSISAFKTSKNKYAHLSQRKLPVKKESLLDDFMDEEEEEATIKKPRKKQVYKEENHEEEEDEEDYGDIDEGALDDFFSQLEQDIDNYDSSKEDDFDEEVNEEDVIKFEKELSEALGEEDGNSNELPELKTWQKKKLARALKNGKRKTSIKKLAEEACLERYIVLEILRKPPPELLIMSASLRDEPDLHPQIEPDDTVTESVTPAPIPTASTTGTVEDQKTEPEPEEVEETSPPEKRLKKVQIDTLETVYFKSKRPTKEMIDSIGHVTNLSRRKIVKWFEEKRMQDAGSPRQPSSRGVYQPSSRRVYKRSKPETVSTR